MARCFVDGHAAMLLASAARLVMALASSLAEQLVHVGVDFLVLLLKIQLRILLLVQLSPEGKRRQSIDHVTVRCNF